MSRLLFSGTGLAALGWLHCFAILWAIMLGAIEPGWNIAGIWLFGLFIALGAAAKRT